MSTARAAKSTPVGFEPTRGDPIGLAGRRLNRSAKVSSARSNEAKGIACLSLCERWDDREAHEHAHNFQAHDDGERRGERKTSEEAAEPGRQGHRQERQAGRQADRDASRKKLKSDHCPMPMARETRQRPEDFPSGPSHTSTNRTLCCLTSKVRGSGALDLAWSSARRVCRIFVGSPVARLVVPDATSR
jgi:hypothetical protein